MIESDASNKGWDANSQGTSTEGPWTPQERVHHSNYLKLLAAFLALKLFAASLRSKTILLHLDNVSAIAFINKMGVTHSHILSNLAVQIWDWYIERDFIIHAEHIPGVENLQADWKSRHFKDSSH